LPGRLNQAVGEGRAKRRAGFLQDRSPRSVAAGRIALLVVLVATLSWSGCAGPSRQGAQRAKAPVEPARAVQTQLLQNAQELHRQGRGQAAAELLERWLRTYPQSPLVMEARWWLARSYDQAGNVGAALAQYRVVAQANVGNERVSAARSRIAALEQSQAGSPSLTGGQAAVALSVRHLPTEGLEEWFGALAKAGVTTLVLDAGTEQGYEQGSPSPSPAGVYFKTDWAPTVDKTIERMIPVAHRQGLALCVAVSPWRMAWVDPKLGWQNRSYDAGSGRIEPSSLLDLFHPAFQEYLIGLLTDLAGAGVDGVLFRATPGADPEARISPYAQEGFERDFGVRLNPDALRGDQEAGAAVPDSLEPMPGRRMPGRFSGKESEPRAYAPEAWRWFGWQSRQTLKVLDRLTKALRTRSPTIRVGLELHEESVTEPVRALVRYQEDALEAKRFSWDFYVIAPSVPLPSKEKTKAAGTVVKAMALLGETRPIWVGTRLSASDLRTLPDRLPVAADRAAMPRDAGLWYIMQAGAIP